MKDEGIEMQINWESFATYNHDVRGIRFKFEDLCHQLFANENLSGILKFQEFNSKRKLENEKSRKRLVRFFMRQQICCGKKNMMQQKRLQFLKVCHVPSSLKL